MMRRLTGLDNPPAALRPPPRPPSDLGDQWKGPLPPTGARTLASRTAFCYGYTLDSPGMIMRIPDVGSQYLMGFLDANKNPFDGAKTYKVTLPPNIPARAFWSFTLHDNQTRSMPAKASADGSTTVYFSPTQPAGVDRGNWIQTDPARGWFTILRLDSPLESFFDKSWRPGEIELVKERRDIGAGDTPGELGFPRCIFQAPAVPAG